MKLRELLRDRVLAFLPEEDFNTDSGEEFGPQDDSRAFVAELDDANLVGSPHKIIGDNPTGLDTSRVGHYPVLDIDFPVYTVPSKTPGHYHLYIQKSIPWHRYVLLLGALEACGIIEAGYYRASLARGATYVRLPAEGTFEKEE